MTNLKDIKSIIDLSETNKPDSLLADLLGMLNMKVSKRGLKGPWKHDFKNYCVKCSRVYHLQKHHIVYNPEVTAFLCEFCHIKITNLNTIGSRAAFGSLKTRLVYTNRIRVILWRWFLHNTWPIGTDKKPIKQPTQMFIRKVLSDANFVIQEFDDQNIRVCSLPF